MDVDTFQEKASYPVLAAQVQDENYGLNNLTKISLYLKMNLFSIYQDVILFFKSFSRVVTLLDNEKWYIILKLFHSWQVENEIKYHIYK